MSDFKISVSGKPLENYSMRPLRQGTDLLQAESHLKEHRDGLDTLGVKVEGQDFLITGRGLQAHPGDLVSIEEGQAVGRIAFVEQEDNTFKEGVVAGFKTKIAGLEHSVAALPVLSAVALVKGTVAAVRGARATEEQVQQVTEGEPLKSGQLPL